MWDPATSPRLGTERRKKRGKGGSLDILTRELATPAQNVLGRPIHHRQQTSMRDGAIRSVHNEVIRDIRRARTEVRLGVVLPLLREIRAVLPDHRPARAVRHVKARRGDDDIEVLRTGLARDARRRDLANASELDGDVVALDGLEVVVARREAAAADLEVRDQLRAQDRVVVQALLHARLEQREGAFLLGAVLDERVEELVHGVLNAAAQLEQLVRVLAELALLLLGVPEVGAVGCELGGEVGRDPRRATDVGCDALGRGLHLREDLDG